VYRLIHRAPTRRCNDVASPNFGRVLEAGAPRLVQFGIKLIY